MFQVKNISLILIGIFIGALSFFYPIFLLYFFLLGILLFFLLKVDSKDRSKLIKIVCIGLFLRICCSMISIFFVSISNVENPAFYIQVIFPKFGALFRDLFRDIENGINLFNYFQGAYGDISLKYIGTIVASEGVPNYLNMSSYLLGLLNYFFGVSFLNLLCWPLIGIWVVVLTYCVAKEAFDHKVALMSSLIIALTPSLIGWAAINIRTSVGIMTFFIAILFVLKFSKKNRIIFMFPVVLSFFLIFFFKSKIFMPYFFIMMLILFLSLHLRIFFKINLLILFCFVVVAFPSFFQKKIAEVKTTIVTIHYAGATLEGNNNPIKIFPDKKFYQEDVNAQRVSWKMIFFSLPKGAAYFLFSPFFWRFNSPRQWMTYPQNIVWYFLFPFCIFGIIISLRFYYPGSFLLLVFSIFWISVMSLTVGNIGTLFRQRDFIFPFLMMFSMVGVRHFFIFWNKKFLIPVSNEEAGFS